MSGNSRDRTSWLWRQRRAPWERQETPEPSHGKETLLDASSVPQGHRVLRPQSQAIVPLNFLCNSTTVAPPPITTVCTWVDSKHVFLKQLYLDRSHTPWNLPILKHSFPQKECLGPLAIKFLCLCLPYSPALIGGTSCCCGLSHWSHFLEIRRVSNLAQLRNAHLCI